MAQTLEERIAAREKTLGTSLEDRIAAREAELAKKENVGSAVGEFAGRSVLDALFQSPKLLAMGSAGIQAPFSERGFSEIFEEEQQKFPANLATTTNRVVAGTRAFGQELANPPPAFTGDGAPQPFQERFDTRFDEELLRINAEEERMREKFPNAAATGDITGDILALTGGRLPFAKRINLAETAMAAKSFENSLTKPGTRRLLEKVADSKAVRGLMRGTGRTVETGVEAAILSTLKGGDPLETASFAAGAQATGSAILASTKFVGKHPLLAGAFGFAALIQLSKETIPGGEDDFNESIESGFEKVWWGILAGATATAAGTGRLRGGALAENWPRFADALATIPRANMISLVSDYMKATPDEQQTIEATLEQLQRDPEFFGPEITKRLQQALDAGNLTEALRSPLEQVQESSAEVIERTQEVVEGIPERAKELGEQGIEQLQEATDSLPEKATKALRSAIDKVNEELEKLEKRKRLQEPTAGFDKLHK